MSTPNNQNPLGILWEVGMRVEYGILKGALCDNTSGNTSITSIDLADFTELSDGSYMFYGCSNLMNIEVDFPVLSNGTNMFALCTNLTNLKADFPKLTTVSGVGMFYNCGLKTVNVNLPELVNGENMFRDCRRLSSFNGSLPKLQRGHWMFVSNSSLTDWTTDLPSLIDGNGVFYYNSSLKGFSGKIPNLQSGTDMFLNCVLDSESVLYILRGNGIGTDYEGIPTYTDGKSHPLTLGKNVNFKNSEEIASLLNTNVPIAAGSYSYKGWSITLLG